MELKKLCVGRLAGEVMTVMLKECALGPYLGIPSSISLEDFKKIFNYNCSRGLLPITLLSSLFKDLKDLERFHKRC